MIVIEKDYSEGWAHASEAAALDAFRVRYDDDPSSHLELTFFGKHGRRIGSSDPDLYVAPAKPLVPVEPIGTPLVRRASIGDEVDLVEPSDLTTSTSLGYGQRDETGQPDTLRKEDTMGQDVQTNGGSPFVQAAAIDKRVKAMFFGGSGVGKTTLALHFPKPIMIDFERGSDFYGAKFEFARPPKPPATVNELYDQIKWLLGHPHPHSTLIIDPISVYWEMLQAKWVDILGLKAQRKSGISLDEFDLEPRHWKVIKDELKEFLRLLLELDMNVIAIAREKREYSDSQFMKAVGDTFDGEKNLPYMFDVLVRLYKDPTGKRYCHILKDRSGRLPTQDFLTDFKVFEEAFGKDALGKTAVAAPEKVEAAKPVRPPETVASPAAETAKPAVDIPPTDKQISYAHTLCQQIHTDLDSYLMQTGRVNTADGEPIRPATKREFSVLLDELVLKAKEAAGAVS